MRGWPVTAAGTLGFDDLTTEAGRRTDVPGGSALYFSLAARPLAKVLVAAVVGSDGAELVSILEAAEVDCSSVSRLSGATYRWTAEHRADQGVPVSEEQQFGVYADWSPDLSEDARASPMVFLGSMPPQRQMEVLEQCAAPRLVAIDTMRDFIAADREALTRVLERCQALFANEAELQALLPERRVSPTELAGEALERWGLDLVVLKQGARGVSLVTSQGARPFAAPTGGPVVDPTGAGDALAGGLLGRLAQLGRLDDPALADAVAWGLAAAANAISAFGPEGLARADRG